MNKFRGFTSIWIIILVLAQSIFQTNAQASARKNADDIVKLRIDTMTLMGKGLKVILDMIKGNTAFDVVNMVETANQLFEDSLLSAKQFSDPFNSNSDAVSRALPAIWKRKDEFDRLFTDLQDQSEMLAQFAASGDFGIIRTQFAEVVEICSACHERFRRPKSENP